MSGGLSIGPELGLNSLTGGGEPNPPYPAPFGWRWVFLTDYGNRQTDGGQRLIDLERIVA